MQKRILSGFFAFLLAFSIGSASITAEEPIQNQHGSASESQTISTEPEAEPVLIQPAAQDSAEQDPVEQTDPETENIPPVSADPSAQPDEEITPVKTFAIITSKEITGGTILSDKESAAPGETVTITVTPDAGMRLTALTENSEPIEPVDEIYQFVMPDSDVELQAVFEAEEEQTVYLFSPVDFTEIPASRTRSFAGLHTLEAAAEENTFTSFHDQLSSLGNEIYTKLTAQLSVPSEEDLIITLDVPVPTSTDIMPDVQSAVDAIKMDNPEIFWLRLNNGTITNGISVFMKIFQEKYTGLVLRFSGDTIHGISNLDETATYGTAVDAIAAQDAMNQEISRVVSESPSGTIEKLKYFHDYVVNKTTYHDTGASTKNDGTYSFIYSPTGVFLRGSAVCEGYSKAFKLLCDRAGLNCIEVVGCGDYSGNNNHMWNYAKVDGSWYLVDTTHDDTAPIRYDYFLSTWTSGTYHKPDGRVSGAGKVFTYPMLSPTAYSAVSNTAYTVTFDSQGGTAVSPMTVTSGQTILLPSCTKYGYTFSGWYSADTLWTSSTPVTGNLTLTARWTAVAYSSSSGSSGGSHSGGGGGGGGGGSRSGGGGGSSASPNLIKAAFVSKNAVSSIASAISSANKVKLKSAAAYIAIPSGNEISPATVQAVNRVIKAAVKNKSVSVTPFLTLSKVNSSKKLVSRIAFNPLTFTSKSNINLGVALDDPAARLALSKQYKKPMQLIRFNHNAAFGMDVAVTASLDFKGMNRDTLKFYTYNRAKKTLTEIAAPGYWFDKEGNLHFTVNTGFTVVVTDSPLIKK